MGQQLAIMDENFDFENASYEQLAAISGQSFGDTNDTREILFPTMSVNVKRKIEIKGEKIAVPNPAFRMTLDGTTVFLTDDIETVFLGKHWVFKRWDSEINEWVAQSEIVPDFRGVDVPDSSGGFNAGRATGFLDDDAWDAMTAEQQARQKAAKLYMVVHLVIKGKGKTLEGEPVDLDEWTPVRVLASRSVQSKYKSIFDAFHKSRTPSFTKLVDVSSIEVEEAGSFEVGVPTFVVNQESSVNLKEIGPFVKRMHQDIGMHNDWVQSEHVAAHRANNQAALDAEFIDVVDTED